VKVFQKYIYWILCTVALLLISVLCLVIREVPREALVTVPDFYVNTEVANEKISVFCAENEKYYVFLPSYTDMSELRVLMKSEEMVSLGGIKLFSDMDCSDFELETEYELVVNEQSMGKLLFYKSANISTMHINTATGSMEYLHDSKDHEEDISMTLYTVDGKIDCLDKNSKIKGRGNSTWNYDKKPYILTLSAEKDLLGMGAATKWVLLANAREEANLNNKIIFELASRTGLECTPEIRWVDLYFNGEYNGLYLLAEKVEIGSNRLNIAPNEGDFLGKIDYEKRWNTLSNPFVSKAGRVVDICAPEIITQEEENEMIHLINQMEEALFSGEDLSNNSMIDLDSWIRRYLIDEISGNIDADLASSYFYFLDGMFYAGPIWDYDAALGNENSNQEPHAFIAKNKQKSSVDFSLYYDALYNNQSFYSRMVEIYSLEFLPVLENIIDKEIDEMASVITASAQMNGLRWKTMYQTAKIQNPKAILTVEEIKDYLEQRMEFLNSAWIENEDYCTIQFENSPGNQYWNVSIKKGNCVETTYVDLVDTIWKEEKTGEIIDFSQPINEDVLLVRQGDSGLATRDYIVFLSVAMLLSLLSGFGIIEIYRFNTTRRR